MKFLRIGLTKLKVVLTKEERISLLPCGDIAECDRLSVKEALGEILHQAKQNCNFDIGDDKVLVQLYPENNGGCEIFITKLLYLSQKEQKEVLGADNVTSCERVEAIFKFSRFEDLLRAARAVSGAVMDSDLYYSGTAYYIKATENSINGICWAMPFYEFGERVKEIPVDALYERGKLIFRGDAIKKLSVL